ncbi:hypothetical protein FKM82_021142 [Ascaphus truei]
MSLNVFSLQSPGCGAITSAGFLLIIQFSFPNTMWFTKENASSSITATRWHYSPPGCLPGPATGTTLFGNLGQCC